MITHHTALLNWLIDRFELKSYLELGVQNPANNFDKIKCQHKHGVDPDLAIKTNRIYGGTSDEFFDMLKSKGSAGYGAVFIDGLHHADQVKKDFENSLCCLNDGGFIVLHDCLPEQEETTCVPRGTQKIWHGDVYKFCLNMQRYQGIDFVTLNADNGCMIVWKNDNRNHELWADMGDSWKTYIKYRSTKMKIIEPVALVDTFNKLFPQKAVS